MIPQTIGGTSVVYVLHDATNPEKYGGLPSNPRIPISFTLWKNWFKPYRSRCLDDGLCRCHPALRNRRPPSGTTTASSQGNRRRRSEEGELSGHSSAKTSDRKPDHFINRIGLTVVYVGELLRHRAYTRFLHWMYGIFFFLALLSGFGIYMPWIFRWFTPLFGGGAMTRILHPWFGLGFCLLLRTASPELGYVDEVGSRRYTLDEADQELRYAS